MASRESVDFNLPIQLHSRPVTPDEQSYNAKVLVLDDGKTETELDEHFVRVARDLGLNVPEGPKANLDLIASNVSELTVSSSLQDTSTIPSRTSDSTRPTSCSSSERRVDRSISPTVPSRLTTPSVTSPQQSVLSFGSYDRSYSKIRKSIRRLSAFTRRRSVSTDDSSIPTRQSFVETPKKIESRPATAHGSRPSISSASPPVLPPISITPRRAGILLPSLSDSRIATPSRHLQHRPLTPPREDETETGESRAARERSLKCGHLQRLRMRQLDEQSRFLNYRHSQLDTIHQKYADERKRVTRTMQESQKLTQQRHAEVHVDLEQRHLSAEIDLARSLETERRACETKLKYMEAYCNGKLTLPGMPARQVTDADSRKLLDQYNLCNGIEALHSARINVLREKQAKQTERIVAKQAAELEALEEKAGKDLEELELGFTREEDAAKRVFEARKRRLLWRWKVAEAIERRKLELDRGEEFGELPDVIWAVEERAFTG